VTERPRSQPETPSDELELVDPGAKTQPAEGGLAEADDPPTAGDTPDSTDDEDASG
jgi:hypothetical protein